MPLKPGIKSVSSNVSEMMAAGHSQKQAVAAAINMARKTKAGKTKYGAKPPKKES